MPEGSLPYIVIGVSAAVLIAVTVLLARLAWKRQVQRYIVALMARREAISASFNTVEGVLAKLAAGSVRDVLDFTEQDSEERRAVREIAERMQIQSAELADLPLPKSLWTLADLLGTAATSISHQASRVGETSGEEALDALLELDLDTARTALLEADGQIAALSTEYDVTDAAVYGGGLYI